MLLAKIGFGSKIGDELNENASALPCREGGEIGGDAVDDEGKESNGNVLLLLPIEENGGEDMLFVCFVGTLFQLYIMIF